MNPTIDIWDKSKDLPRGSGSTRDLLSHYREGDKIIVHNAAVVGYIRNLSEGQVPRNAIIVMSDLYDVWRLRGCLRVLVDHAAMDHYLRQSRKYGAAWSELRTLAKMDRHPTKEPTQ